MWDKVRHRCLKKYTAVRELSIDEAMIRYRGYKASVKKFFMPFKPIRVGFKIYVLAESASGAILNFFVHPWKKSTMTGIAVKLAKHHRGHYHHIFTDRLYTSIPLAKALLSGKTYLTGAVKSTSRGLPKELTRRIQTMKKLKRGSFYSRQNGQMVATLWRDSKAMMVLSTAHQGWRDPLVHTVQRKVPGKTGRRTTTIVPAPPQAIDYIRYMGGVDRGDQLRAYYSCSRKAQYWWKKILYFLVDICRVNAYISYSKHRHQEVEDDPSDITVGEIDERSTKYLSHSEFIVRLGQELIDGYARGSSTPQSNPRPVPAHNIMGHTSTRMPGLYPKRCQWCLHNDGVTKSGWTKTTQSGCAACMVNLCPGPCFIKFHQAAARHDPFPATTTDESSDPYASKEKENKQKEKKKKGMKGKKQKKSKK